MEHSLSKDMVLVRGGLTLTSSSNSSTLVFSIDLLLVLRVERSTTTPFMSISMSTTGRKQSRNLLLEAFFIIYGVSVTCTKREEETASLFKSVLIIMGGF